MKQKFPWLFSTLWLAVFVLMLRLGFWQLDRSEEKKELLKQMNGSAQQISSLPELLSIHRFQQVQIAGQWIPEVTFVLANQMHQGRPGYHVYSVMTLAEGSALAMVNRGWVSSSDEIKPVTAAFRTWSLHQSDWPRPGVQLGEQVLSNDAVQAVTYLPKDVTTQWLKERFCGKKASNDCIILPFIFKLNQQMPDGFVRDWKTQIMQPEKHRAYAIQWFTMSLVLMGLYIVFLRKNHASQN